MKLSNFPFKKVYRFSQLLSGVIQNLEQKYQITEAGDGIASQAEDVLEYWDNYSKDITYGRYLTTRTTGMPIDFWVGLDITRTYVKFIIWFKTSQSSSPNGIPSQNIKNLDNAFSNQKLSHAAQPVPLGIEYYWIEMDDADFTSFCTAAALTSSPPPPQLEDFIRDVLNNL
jgi:hypothetical protein